MTGVAVARSSDSCIMRRGASGTVGSGLSSCDIAVGVAVALACGLAVGCGVGVAVTVAVTVCVCLSYLCVSVTNWRVVVVRVVWVGSFRNYAAADNGSCGYAVVVAVSCDSDSSGEEFLVATSEVLLEGWLLPSEGTVGVVGDPLGFELALVWEPGVTDLGAVGAGLSTVLVNSEIELGAI